MSDQEKIFNFSKPPILLIGAGVSKRYLNDYLSWSELMGSLAKRIGVTEKQFIAYLADAKDNAGNNPEMPFVASELKKKLINGIKNGSINPDDIFCGEESKQYLDLIDPIKILAASFFQECEIVSDPMLLEEIESLKKLDQVVPCIVTTNYDIFLEKHIFIRFKVYSSVSDYYYSDSEGIGEIYKIHGTASKPSTMILTQQDYDELKKNSKIVTSKILSALCDYPMVILGYSMEDDDVKGIINDLISSLDKDKLQEVEKNIVYVEYMPGQNEVVRKNRIFPYDDKTMTISTIGTDDFKRIFDELGNIVPSMSPLAVRKARKMVKEIVLSESGANNVALIGVDRIDDVSKDKLVIAFADRETIQRMKKTDLNFYSNRQMIDDIINDNYRYSPTEVMDFFDADKNRLNTNEYFPVFHFVRLAHITKDKFSVKLNLFFERKKMQFEDQLKTIGSRNYIKEANVKNIDDLKNLLYNHPGRFYRSDVIFYYYATDLITEKEAKELLRALSAKGLRSEENTAFRRAVTYLAFKEFC